MWLTLVSALLLPTVHCGDVLRVKVSDGVPLENCSLTLQSMETVLENSLREIHDLHLDYVVEEVKVHLPTSWRSSSCRPSVLTPSASFGNIQGNHIMLRLEGEEPESVQPRGCGSEGSGVNLPVSYLNRNSTSLVRELLNSRFGMYLEDHQHLQVFSSDGLYNRTEQTRHNMVCGGRSPLEIAKVMDTEGNFTKPQFSYTIEGEEHYVLVLDQSNLMDFNQRWTNIKRAFYRFINSLQEGTMLSIITFGKEGSLVLPPTVVTETNREGLHGRIPRRTEEVDQVCVSCGIKLAGDVLKGSSGTVVLVTGNQISTVQQSNIEQIFTILYPAREEGSLGTTYSIIEDESERPVDQLTEVLIDIMNKVEDNMFAKIHQSDHLSYEFSGTFIVEENLKEDITVTLNVDDEQKVEYFEVIDPSGEKNIFSKFEDGMVLLRFPGSSEPGIWTFHAKLYPEAGLPSRRMSVDVVGRGKYAEVKVEGLHNSLVEDLSRPVEILARVERGELPVFGARVRAVVSGPDTQTEVELKDGRYPDIKVGDGIYTGYLPQFSTRPGYYVVRILATDNNGQSYTFSNGAPIPTGSFRRHISSPSFYVRVGVPQGEDVIPPSRVTDLTIKATNISNLDSIGNNSTTEDDPIEDIGLYHKLYWTSPGEDYNQGRVTRYTVRCHTDPLVLLSKESFIEQGFAVSIPEDFYPLPAGSMESTLVKVPWTNEIFYYALLAYDEAGNQGSISNLVKVFVPEKNISKALELEDEEQLLSGLKLGEPSWLLDSDKVFIIAGVSGGLILIVIILVLALLVRAKKMSRTKTQWVQDTYEAGFQPDTKVEKVETESGIYSWLESLPRSEDGRRKGCEEGSNSSRPTTSTDDSISDSGDQPRRGHERTPATESREFDATPLHRYLSEDQRTDSGEFQQQQYNSLEEQLTTAEQQQQHQRSQANPEEPSHDDYAQQVLTRSLYYYSFREGGMGRTGGLRVTPNNFIPSGAETGSVIDQDYTAQTQIRKKRHESVV